MTLFSIEGQCSLRLLLAVPEFSLWGRERLKKQKYPSFKLQCAFIQTLCVCLLFRGPASDQPDDEGTFRGSDCVAGEAAGGAGLPGEQAGGGPGSHGDTDRSKPGAEQENRGGGETRGNHGRFAGEGVLQ